MNTTSDNKFDQRLFSLVPHRPPMLLINKFISVNSQQSHSQVYIEEDSACFYPSKGVPSWIGIEYMGQTASLIAGYQLENGDTQPHTGFLLGTRRYDASLPYFSHGMLLDIQCQEKAIVGDGLATFDCEICSGDSILAKASLSVFRKMIN